MLELLLQFLLSLLHFVEVLVEMLVGPMYRAVQSFFTPPDRNGPLTPNWLELCPKCRRHTVQPRHYHCGVASPTVSSRGVCAYGKTLLAISAGRFCTT